MDATAKEHVFPSDYLHDVDLRENMTCVYYLFQLGLHGQSVDWKDQTRKDFPFQSRVLLPRHRKLSTDLA